MANSTSQNPRGRILLVDDNSLGLAARRSVLEELGHKVQTSGTPAEALDLCGKQRFDVVVTDYKMPKMDGIEFIGRFRKLDPAGAVILISGFTDTLGLNDLGRVVLRTTVPLFFDEYRRNRTTGSFILIDEASSATVGAGMILGPA